MFDQNIFQSALQSYKQDFAEQVWPDEKYKWIAVKHFQDHWDVDAENFSDMWLKATDKTENLLTSYNYYPRQIIREFATYDPKETRTMFIRLFDEGIDLYERITRFITDADEMRREHYPGSRTQHYQDLNSITTYLWLRFPDRYYKYRYSELRNISRKLDTAFKPKMGDRERNLKGFIELYDSISALLLNDAELTHIFNSVITPDCYSDPRLKTLTSDFGFYISQFKGEIGWIPKDYNPGLTVEDWIDLLNDPEIFNPSARMIVARFKDIGGSATCKQLALKYGKNYNFYNNGSVNLAKRIIQKKEVSLSYRESEGVRYWPILYEGKQAGDQVEGVFIWRLREELSQALDRMPYKEWITDEHSSDPASVSYWWLNANPSIRSFSEIRVGETDFYTKRSPSGHQRRIYQNFLDAKAGDIVICYESSPVKKIVALAKITVDTDTEKLFFEKTEELIDPIQLSDLSPLPELGHMEYFLNPIGSLFRLTEGEFEVIMGAIRETNPEKSEDHPFEKYQKETFLSEVYMDEKRYDTLTHLLKSKKNIILQGAPGTGKTFVAKRLAYSIIGEEDDERIEMIQFHQNFSYEDFVIGYRPTETGFELKQGMFYRFCNKASNEPDKDFFLIIDEINRGNLSKILGELLMLIEKDYRGTKLTLAYTGQRFSVPDNIYIIGLMNTADRSLALIDYALRRRFSFFDMEPAFNHPGFMDYQQRLNDVTFNNLIDTVKDLNRAIESDDSLGKGFCIGHSYFCGQIECTEEWMRQVVYHDILPTLREYWFDNPKDLQHWENKFNGLLNG